jgi:hypothetical protein
MRRRSVLMREKRSKYAATAPRLLLLRIIISLLGIRLLSSVWICASVAYHISVTLIKVTRYSQNKAERDQYDDNDVAVVVDLADYNFHPVGNSQRFDPDMKELQSTQDEKRNHQVFDNAKPSNKQLP